MALEGNIAKALIQKKKTLSVAESCTGGLVSERLTRIPGSSKFFHLGLVTYHNGAKKELLRIPQKVLSSHGAVSLAVAEGMAQNVRRLLATDYGVGITGIAGPGGGTKNKPIGLVYIAVSSGQKTLSFKSVFKGTRKKIRSSAATKALRLLLKLILSA